MIITFICKNLILNNNHGKMVMVERRRKEYKIVLMVKFKKKTKKWSPKFCFIDLMKKTIYTTFDPKLEFRVYVYIYVSIGYIYTNTERSVDDECITWNVNFGFITWLISSSHASITPSHLYLTQTHTHWVDPSSRRVRLIDSVETIEDHYWFSCHQ